MINYGKMMADAATGGFDTGYTEAQTNKRAAKQQEHDKFMQLEKILADSNASMDKFEQQKALNIQQHELKEQESGIISKRQGFIESGLGNILGSRNMSAKDKTPLVRNKILELQKLGLASEVNVDNIRISDENPDIMLMTNPETGEDINIDTSTMFETQQGVESFYRSKFTQDDQNPYDKTPTKGDDKQSQAEKDLNISISEAERILTDSKDDATRWPITRIASEYGVKMRLSPEQEALKTVGSNIKGMLFKKFGYRNEAEFKNLPDLSPDKSVEANLAILKELKNMSGIGGSSNDGLVMMTSPDQKTQLKVPSHKVNLFKKNGYQ